MNLKVSISVFLFFVISNLSLTQQQPKTMLGDILNPDGTVNTSRQISGSINTRGWKMSLGKDGAPHFAQPVDEGFDYKYYQMGVNKTGTTTTVNAITFTPSGDIFIGGTFSVVDSVYCQNLARWSPTAGWNSVGNGVPATVTALLYADSVLYVGGNFVIIDGVTNTKRIARWSEANGWQAMDNGLNGNINDIVMNPISKTIFACGKFVNTGRNSDVNGVAQWSGDLNGWTALGAGLKGEVFSLVPFGSNGLFIAGAFNSSTDDSYNYVTYWSGGSYLTPTSPSLNGAIYSMCYDGNVFYVGGNFTDAGGISTADYIAKWNQTNWFALGTGLNGPVYSVTKIGDTVFAAGGFSNAGADTNADYIAKFTELAGWSSLGSASKPNNSTPSMRKLVSNNGYLYTCGSINNISGDPGINFFAKWNNNQWFPISKLPVSLGFNNPVSAIAFNGKDIYVGGSFTSAGRDPHANYIAKWNGTNWSAIGDGLNGIVYKISVNTQNGRLFALGAFTNAGGDTLADKLAQWDGVKWSSLGTGIQGSLSTMAVNSKNGELYVGGSFSNAGGVAGLNNLAKWDGSSWSSVGSFSSTSAFTVIYALTVDSRNGDLYVGGYFTDVAGNTNADYIAKWNGTSWTSIGNIFPTTPGIIHGITINSITNDIYAHGEFIDAGNDPSADVIAKYSPGQGWVRFSNKVFSTLIRTIVFDSVKSDVYVSFAKSTSIGDKDSLLRWNSTSGWTSVAEYNTTSGVMALTGRSIYIPGSFITVNGKPSPYFIRYQLAGGTFPVVVTAEHGTVAKNPNLTSYTIGSNVQLTASPASGYTFTGWSGEVASGINTNPLQVTTDDYPRYITANFIKNNDIIDNNNFDDTTGIKWTADPDIILRKSSTRKHSGDSSLYLAVSSGGLKKRKTDNPGMVLQNVLNPGVMTFWLSNDVPGELLFYWNNQPIDSLSTGDTTWVQYTVPFYKQGRGDIKIAYNSTITAYYFDDIIITDNLTLSLYTLQVNGENGSFIVSPQRDHYSVGSPVTIIPVPSLNYHFSYWSGDVPTGHESDTMLTVQMDSNLTIIGHFLSTLGVNDLEMPKVFALYQNFPNPFNPSTEIRYSLPTRTMVSLKIYNVLGQEVVVLVNGLTQEAGYQKITWNASGMPSGIYLYKLQAGDFTSVRKLILMK